MVGLGGGGEQTRLLREAKAAGAVPVSGLEMFVGQAAAQFTLFTGAWLCGPSLLGRSSSNMGHPFHAKQRLTGPLFPVRCCSFTCCALLGSECVDEGHHTMGVGWLVSFTGN